MGFSELTSEAGHVSAAIAGSLVTARSALTRRQQQTLEALRAVKARAQGTYAQARR